MAGGAYGERSLKETPTWAVALVSAVFVVFSTLIEHGIHSLGMWFQKRQKKAMNEALEKIKSELMLLGFISLLITVGTKPVSKICIPAKAGDMMLPCKPEPKEEYSGDGGPDDRRRKLATVAVDVVWRRALAPASGEEDYCSQRGKVPLVSQSGVHQLHIFIFVLAVFHVLYSVITMALAQAKMKKWKAWEQETNSLEYQFSNDPSRFRLTRQTSFVRRHSGLSTTPGLRWIVAFLRQFLASVTKVDYLTMRHGFITAHFAPNSKFDFHKYIKRSMEDDFKKVVGISVPLWIFATIFQLLNVYRWYTLFAISFMPPAILLLVGTKLELIMMEMSQQIQETTTIIRGVPVVEPSNKYFWFNRPHLILFLIHFTLFENAFQMAYFLWIWYEFGITSCFHENLPAIWAKVFLGVAFQVLCSYITFPLYALVTQMGSHMKKPIFEEQTAKALKKWRKAAREREKLRKLGGADVASASLGFNIIMSSPGQATSPSHGSCPFRVLHRFTHSSTQSAPNSPRFDYFSDQTPLELEGPVLVSSDDQLGSRHRSLSSGSRHRPLKPMLRAKKVASKINN